MPSSDEINNERLMEPSTAQAIPNVDKLNPRRHNGVSVPMLVYYAYWMEDY